MSEDKQQHRTAVANEYTHKLGQGNNFCQHQWETDFGYTPAELETLPAGLQDESFGCANPLSMGQIRPGDRVLDLGSGAGMDVILAAQRVGASGKVIGVDMTGAMVTTARANIKAAGMSDRAEIRQGLIESLPVETASVDWVISNCVVSLSAAKAQVFAEVFRVLKPGGKMLLTDQVIAPLPRWLRALAALKSPGVATALDKTAYLACVRNAGLTEVSLRGELIYDTTMLRGLLEGELNLQTTLWRALRRWQRDQLLSHLLRPWVNAGARYGANKVASIKVYAEKPLTA